MNNPHYEAVRSKVIIACPELMELSFGCYVKSKFHPALERVTEDFSDSLIQCESSVVERKEIEIIGHPIHLNHILRALNNSSAKRILLHGDGQLDVEFETKDFIDTFILGTDWDLTKDDLASQSPEIWEALDKMLSV